MKDPQPLDTPLGQGELIFALDIGTRSIIGIVGVREGDLLRILGIEQREHTKRAMIDGQIEDIEQTARVARQVREALEERLGLPLRRVHVAAAGRALKTRRASFSMELDAKEPVLDQQVQEMEVMAIRQAYDEVMEEQSHGEGDFSCVGHSVIRYYLDGYPLSTLQGHRGREAKIDIIATFLPSEVVESLYTTMSRIQLAVSGITLEPIAAMNAIIPQELRLLNLALVDIGAGTSDIAISRDGSVYAYTMATIAGDEITEAIIQEYLVDFDTAEAMKRQLGDKVETITYSDILGFAYTLPAQELQERIQPVVEKLGKTVCDKIMEINEKPPAAVFLVGGGSKIPGLCRLVAQNLDIAENKVAVGGSNYMKKMVLSQEEITNPEYATPMGIAITAMTAGESDGLAVEVNGNKVRLVSNGGATVMDVLMMDGFKHSQIIGRGGKSVTYNLNGVRKVSRGGFATSAVITVNGQPASITTPVRPGDKVVVEPAVQGADASLTVRDAVGGCESFPVAFGSAEKRAGTVVRVNGQPAAPDQRIANLDEVATEEAVSIADLCTAEGMDAGSFRFFVNGREETADYVLRPHDEIQYFPIQADPPEAPKAAGEAPGYPADGNIQKGPLRVTLNGRAAELPPKPDGTPYQFVDMLNFVDIDPSKPKGNIVLRINGQEASYLDTVAEGDMIDIYWDQFGLA